MAKEIEAQIREQLLPKTGARLRAVEVAEEDDLAMEA